ncbi:MAG: NUDIX domain-containing protein [Candidatus Dormiibacterota bacterium]
MSRIVGAQAVIADPSGRVLLQFRSWPPGWEPPGGHVAPGEDPAQTVVRETEEECGVRVEIVRRVGLYHFRGIRVGTDAVFLAHPVGGRLKRSREALRVAWAAPDRLPAATFPWFRRRIADALAFPPEAEVERWQEVTLADVARHGLALGRELSRAGRGRGGD